MTCIKPLLISFRRTLLRSAALAFASSIFLSFSIAQGFFSRQQTGSEQSRKPVSTSNTGSQNGSTKLAKKKQSNTFSNDYREAAMLAQLALNQLSDKVHASPKVRETYDEGAVKAMTIAEARARNSADHHLYLLLTELRGIILSRILWDQQISFRALAGEKDFSDIQKADLDLYHRYRDCGDHV